MADETKPDKKTDVKPDKKPDSQPDGDKKPQHTVEDYEKPDKKPDSQPDGDKQPPNLQLKRPPKPLQVPIELPIYEDEFMKWDEVEEMYVLTEKAVRPFVNIRERMTETAESLDRDIYNTLLHISRMVYSLLRQNPTTIEDNNRITQTDLQARSILKRALQAQAEHIFAVGDLSYSSNEEDRKQAIAPAVRGILLTPIRSIGRSLLYMGVL